MSIVVSFIVRLLAPFIAIFAVYVIINGHVTPGGGFQGGAVLGGLFIALSIVLGPEQVTPAACRSVSGRGCSIAAPLAFVSMGMLGLALTGYYLGFPHDPRLELAAQRDGARHRDRHRRGRRGDLRNAVQRTGGPVMLAALWDNLDYAASMVLFLIGLYVVIAKNNLIKKFLGLNIMETAIFTFIVALGRRRRWDASDHGPRRARRPSRAPSPRRSSSPASWSRSRTTALALSLIIRIYQQRGTIEADELREME